MTTSPSTPSELETVAATLAQLQKRIEAFDTALHSPEDDPLYKPPLIDHTSIGEYVQPELEGWKKYVGQVQAEADWINGLLHSSNPPTELGTSNTSHLVTMFNSILTAPRPIVCINHHFAFPSSSFCSSCTVKRGKAIASTKSKMIKVDVVARGGKDWFRTNTIKLQKLMSELHEQDSYLNSDFESSDASSSSSRSRSNTNTRPPLQNSILTTAQHLLSAASSQPGPPKHLPPKITYRLTRLLPESEYSYPDSRVGETFELLRSWGITLVFGDGGGETVDGPRRVRDLKPTMEINLDLSVIIALVSDITHHPLPANLDEARARFLRPIDSVNLDDNGIPHGGKPSPKLHPDTTSGAKLVDHPGLHSKHTRNLVLQITQEMERGIIQEILSVLSTLPGGGKDVRFWCTAGAKRGLEEIVRVNEVIGDGQEQRRSVALFEKDGESGAFWRGSRHEGREGVLKDFKIHVFEEANSSRVQVQDLPRTAFMQRLVEICTSLNETTKPKQADRAIGQESSSTITPTSNTHANPRNPSLVTLDSLRQGAYHGMTTLTNNRMSVKQLLRSLRKFDGWTPGDYDDLLGAGTAAVWVMEARSLAEWTRVKFANGNYAKGGQDGMGHRWPRVSQFVRIVDGGEAQSGGGKSDELGEAMERSSISI